MTFEEFIEKWENCPGSERGNYAVFLTELTGALGVDAPGPNDDYRMDAPVPGGAEGGGTGFIDLYKRGSFILEAKQSRICELPIPPGPEDDGAPRVGRYDELMRRAFRQARRYAQSLPEPPWPPFIITLDVGRAFEIYFDYAGNGRDYRFFPDRASYRIPICDLRQPAIQDRLRAIWTNPTSLDPRLITAEVTREVAARLASVSAWLEQTQRLKTGASAADWEHSIALEETSLFLMRILFCMFAEDAGLLSENREERPFKDFLRRTMQDDELFRRGLTDLWQKMGQANLPDRWTFAFEHSVKYFNGSLFAGSKVYELARTERGELLAAAEHEWKDVEPAIFGTLLEQALTPSQRSQLGAHYTPRPYVERLVEATITDVLRSEWEIVEAGLESLDADDRLQRLRLFHERLGEIVVLDPACGTGNFLYVAMEALLGIENKVIQAIEDVGGEVRSRIGPAQFHGLEKNPRAAKIAELVLWIGWLRWSLRNGAGVIEEPILAERANINFGRAGGYDAVLSQDETGAPDLVNPRQPEWPLADFIIGNPPFIGKGAEMRRELGGEYVEALRRANSSVPASSDFVMQWWDRAAALLTMEESRLQRFGFVTTNSIRQTFNRRVPNERGLGSQISIVFGVPDHPWYKLPKNPSKRGGRKSDKTAAVRIAMTSVERGLSDGVLLEVEYETRLDTDSPTIRFARTSGRINSDLSIGPDVTTSHVLKANRGLAYNGMMLAGQGFKLRASEAQHLRQSNAAGIDGIVRQYVGGGDLTDRGPKSFIIDFTGLREAEARLAFPECYQVLLQSVKLERDTNSDKSFREKWWLFGRTRPDLRRAMAGLSRYIATTETAKHRFFQFVPSNVVPDHMVVAVGCDDGFHLGVLSSRIHVRWALRAGGTLEDRPRYNKSRVFDRFPFPLPSDHVRRQIGELAEELDATRKAALAEVSRLTMTEIYNWRERIAAGEQLQEDDLDRAVAARAFIVHRLHEQIDEAVAEAYGWPTDLAPAEIVARLVALNSERAAEEKSGKVRWLRPDYQEPRFREKKAKKQDPGSSPK